MEHALAHLPAAERFQTTREYREYLGEKIRSNSQQTRKRTASYLTHRFFPGEVLHRDLVRFAAAVGAGPALCDAIFYLTCRMERIIGLVAEEVIHPSLPEGGVSRGRILDFVQSSFPSSKSAKDMSQAIVRTYDRLGVGAATATRLKVSTREGRLEAFGYILHLECPEPGMYSFERLFDGPMRQWLLWDRQWMVRQLYALRERGLLSKVSGRNWSGTRPRVPRASASGLQRSWIA